MKYMYLITLLTLTLLFTTSHSRRRPRLPDVDVPSPQTNNSVEEGSFRAPALGSEECRVCHCHGSPRCPPGVSLLQDGCGCCKVCARQLEESCDLKRVCDVHKKLYCDSETGTCKASPGRSCNVEGKWYENGELFNPSCRAACSCIDGDLGCIPTCTTPRASPVSMSCLHPSITVNYKNYPDSLFHPVMDRLIRRKGQCCGEWVCLENGKLEKDMLPFENQVKGHQKMQVTFRGDCMVQTTPWSPCSKTCGFGVSERVTNDNKGCEWIKEIRLCNLRPCSLRTGKLSSKKRCRKNVRHHKRVQFSLSGCLSADIYRPRYCGLCAGKCCDPRSSKTVTVEFICKDGSNSTTSFTRDMMMIRKCHCHECIHDNNIFSSAYTGLNDDVSRLN